MSDCFAYQDWIVEGPIPIAVFSRLGIHWEHLSILSWLLHFVLGRYPGSRIVKNLSFPFVRVWTQVTPDFGFL